MKAIVVNKPGKIGIEEVPIPKPNAYEALVKITCCSICNGTDLNILSGEFPHVKSYPGILGHESAGVVVKTGEKVKNFKVGDIVLRPSARYHGEEGDKMGSFWGGMAEFGLVVDKKAMQESDLECSDPHADMNQLVPASIGPYLGSISITWKETLSALETLGDISNKNIIIWGAGPVGLAFIKWAKTLGAAKIVACARRWESLFWAQNMGASFIVNESRCTSPENELKNTCMSFDIGIDAVGSNRVVNSLLKLIGEKGKVGVYGISPNNDTDELEQDNRIVTMTPDEVVVHERVMNMIRWNSLPLAETVGSIVPMEHALDAFESIQKKRLLKAIIDINPDEQGKSRL